ncbi:uncharacterized protein LOC108679379 [Hyalella azteca]|uniref:Uncharacterized protein LOC108679379 n=1 Tax=Hyalella azteca TaxID=294128 RepID=A0A8B7PDX6_HYAAZ|nr:uncharacterized protein LOC108679379 [Hyalella azteca]
MSHSIKMSFDQYNNKATTTGYKMQVTFPLAAFAAVLLVTARCINAQASSGPATTNPAFPGSCYFSDYRVALRPGEKRSLPGRCVELSCERRSGRQLFASQIGCGLTGFPPSTNCRVVTNKLLPHPACCPRLVCNRVPVLVPKQMAFTDLLPLHLPSAPPSSLCPTISPLPYAPPSPFTLPFAPNLPLMPSP